jgi:predicted metal-dependent hydrolase
VSGRGPDCSPPLAAAEQALLARGVGQFNARLFFECHDTLEELWAGLRGDARDLVQGLIQVAVGFHHLGNGNRAGALRLFDRGLERLRRHGERCCGIDAGALRAAVAVWRAVADRGGEPPAEGPPAIRLATDRVCPDAAR